MEVQLLLLCWNGPNGFTTSDSIATGLDIGAYNIAVTDTNGCVFNLNPQIISQPADYLTASFVMDSVVCFAENTGAITTSTSGGTATVFIQLVKWREYC